MSLIEQDTDDELFLENDSEEFDYEFPGQPKDRRDKARRKTEQRRMMEDRRERRRLAEELGMNIPDEWARESGHY
ncbi:hypothetical protein [Pseudomaricurvus sp. HS19]|uniref:hypothetical protein n=1 Tax=Pseudomaricurvus sp. HS19 TaxID=2692626 RepID=UPI00136C26E6|nr:hypothetical protein [Pseudomaricurvus sp. HS19]MYM64526.1 hypothetical protein [Pseudomaricurvus sp. HS19]